MHMGARRPGIPTRDEIADRESQAWDEMVNAMMEEHIARYLEGVEARSLAAMVQDRALRARMPMPKRPNGVQISRFRRPRYVLAQENAFFASRRRADWATTLAWEHVGPEDVLANPAQEFKNLTRLPREQFDAIVEAAAVSGNWCVSRYEPVAEVQGVRSSAVSAPLSLRILAVLRHLATGDGWTSMFTQTKISAPTLRQFYHEFMPWFVQTHYAEWVTGPSGIGFSTAEEVEASEKMFRQMGLPGIVTSMDGVHVRWDRAYDRIRHQFVGKEGYPTVGWNVHVLANGKIVYIAPPQPGATNDKTFLRHDRLISQMRTEDVFTGRQWKVYTRSGGTATLSGCASLCDNGYHQWECCMAGYKHPLLDEDTRWSSRMESARKNVERAFGQLKMRFRLLKVPLLYGQHMALSKVHLAFQACAILHNMLMHVHGLDTIGHCESDWARTAPDVQRARQRIREIQASRRMLPAASGHQALHPHWCAATNSWVEMEIEAGFQQRRQAMVDHYMRVIQPGFDDGRNTGDVAMWLRTAASCRPIGGMQYDPLRGAESDEED
jgi:hypothetical protein